jgi:hypothetical protein
MSNKSEATFHGSDVEPAVPGPIESSLLAEKETVGDWAGHTPVEAKPTWEEQADADLAAYQRAQISDGIRSLVEISGKNSRDHGFHDGFPGANGDAYDNGDLVLNTIQKLMLMGEELFESFGEIRSGRALDEIYFVDKKGLIGPKGHEYPNQVYGQFHEGELVAYTSMKDINGYIPLLKPEGFIVEIADLFIRGADLAYLLGLRGHLVSALEIKHEYNATRPFKHGRQF